MQTNPLSLLEEKGARRPEETMYGEREGAKMVSPAFKGHLAHAHRGKM